MDIKGYGNKINKTHTHSLFSHKQIGKKKLNQNQRQVETNKGKKVNKAFDFRFIKTLSHFTISGDLSAINFKIYFFFVVSYYNEKQRMKTKKPCCILN